MRLLVWAQALGAVMSVPQLHVLNTRHAQPSINTAAEMLPEGGVLPANVSPTACHDRFLVARRWGRA